jgi:chromosome segregation ATPase
LDAARDALDSAEQGKVEAPARGDSEILRAHKQLIDFEVTQQNDLAARQKELQKAREQVTSLKAEMEKLQAAAGEREKELRQRTKERESLETKSQEQLTALRSQVEKLEASLAEERKEREKLSVEAKRPKAESDTQAGGEQLTALRSQMEKLEASLAEERKEREQARVEINRLEEERQRLQTELGQVSKMRQQSAKKEDGILQPPPAEAASQRIKKWQKVDGSLYFGERPPPGSKPVGEVDNPRALGGGSAR